VPRVSFTGNLRRHVDAPSAQVAGATVGEALEAVFRKNPLLRGYVLDDAGDSWQAVSHHLPPIYALKLA
jgi:hypothetical protein